MAQTCHSGGAGAFIDFLSPRASPNVCTALSSPRDLSSGVAVANGVREMKLMSVEIRTVEQGEKIAERDHGFSALVSRMEKSARSLCRALERSPIGFLAGFSLLYGSASVTLACWKLMWFDELCTSTLRLCPVRRRFGRRWRRELARCRRVFTCSRASRKSGWARAISPSAFPN